MLDFQRFLRLDFSKTAILLLAIVLLLHLPFIDADPHINISETSRDAFTDEGLNTNQLRNYIYTGDWDMFECDNLVKNPLFNTWLLPFLKLFGTSRAQVRVFAMLLGFLLLGVLSISSRKFAKVIIILVCITLINFYLFQYEQFAMAEWGACCLMLTSLFFLYKFLINDTITSKIKDLIFAIVFTVLTTGFKIQFVYFQLLIPIAIVIDIIFNKYFETSAKYFFIIAGIVGLVLFDGLYVLMWYNPNEDIFQYVMAQQTVGRWITSNWVHFLRENFERSFLSDYSRLHFFSYIISIFAGFIYAYSSRKRSFIALFGLSLLWSFIELHKLFILYVPTRYLISVYFSQGLVVSVLVAELLLTAPFVTFKSLYRVSMRLIAMFIASVLFLSNTVEIYKLYQSRTFAAKMAGEYLVKNYKGQGSVLGVWGTALSWEIPARTLPIWKDYHYDTEAIIKYPPAFIITEWNQEDSGEALKSAGINLDTISESRKDFDIGRYKLYVYKLK